jgi:hypothetical protein
MKITFPSRLWLFCLLALGTVASICSYAGDAPPVFISCLVNQGKTCQWVKISLPTGDQETMASFPVENFGARVTWSPNLQEGLVWFDHENGLQNSNVDPRWPPGYATETEREFKDKLYRVDLKKKSVQPVTFPHLSENKPDEIAFTTKGQLAAFDTADAPPGTHLEGIENSIARAFVLKGGKWTLIETKPTSAEECDALGVAALDAHKGVGPSSFDILEGHISGKNAESKKELSLLKKFQPKGAGTDDGEWKRVNTQFGVFDVWENIEGDYVYTTGLVLLEQGGQLIRLPENGFTSGDIVGILTRGPYLLISTSLTGCHPRAYDLRSGKLVFKSDSARATVFWPESKSMKLEESSKDN